MGRRSVEDMLPRGDGAIVNVASVNAFFHPDGLVIDYGAAKAALVNVAKALSQELGPKGITVNTIPPGFIDTPMVRRAEASGDLPDVNMVVARTPVRRAGTPDDIAAACAFLCSEEAGYITGQQINVNGGWYM